MARACLQDKLLNTQAAGSKALQPLHSPPVRLGAQVVLQRRLVDEVAGAGDAKVLAVGGQVLVQLNPAGRFGARRRPQ